MYMYDINMPYLNDQLALPSRRSSRVARRRQRMREALVAAGARQFATRGIAAVTVEDLIEEADLSRATFYEFFPNKYKLIESILNPVLVTAIESIRGHAEKPAEQALDGIFETYLLLWREHREGLFLIPAVDPETFVHFQGQHAALNSAILGILVKAEHADLLRNGSAQYSLKIIARTAIPLMRVYGDHPAGDSFFRDAMRALLVKNQ